MSRLRLNKVAEPATPAAGKIEIYDDTVDNKVKTKDEYGVVSVLAPDGWRDRPLIYNSGFQFAQRQVPTTATTYSSIGGRVYSADRWAISNENASVNYQQTDTSGAKETGLGYRYYGRFIKISNPGKMQITQAFEANAIQHVFGNYVRVQVLMKYVGNPMTVRLGLIQLTSTGTVDTIPSGAGLFVTAWGAVGTDPTLGANLAYISPSTTEPSGTISGSAVTCVLTTGWVRYSATFAVPSDAKNLILAVWTNGQPAVNDTLCMSETGLYEGTEIRTNFTPYASVLELLRVQKFYCKTFPLLTAPAQTGGVTGALHWNTGLAAGVTTAHGSWRFPVRMRVAPITTTFYNPSAANAFARNLSLGTDCSATSVANACDTSLDITCTTPASTVIGHTMIVHITADAEI